jgi:hypothetical protein
MGAQIPSDDGSAQLRHAPLQASAQHTPSTQKPLAHWPAAAQEAPMGLRPQLPPLQVFPAAQSESAAQVATQAPASQA